MKVINNSSSIACRAVNPNIMIKVTKVELPYTQRVAAYSLKRNQDGVISYLSAVIGKLINGREYIERGKKTFMRSSGLTEKEIHDFKVEAKKLSESFSDEVLPMLDSSAEIRTGYMDAKIYLSALKDFVK